MHAVDPLQRLRLLRRRVSLVANEISFHHEMTDIFTSLRDLHTICGTASSGQGYD
jgi:hypothetical protein